MFPSNQTLMERIIFSEYSNYVMYYAFFVLCLTLGDIHLTWSCRWCPAGVWGFDCSWVLLASCPGEQRDSTFQPAFGWRQECSQWLQQCKCTCRVGWVGRPVRYHSEPHSGHNQPPSCLQKYAGLTITYKKIQLNLRDPVVVMRLKKNLKLH